MKNFHATRYTLHATRQGQALVELMVAVSVLVVGFLSITSLLSRSLALNRVIAENYTATYLASEGIEVVKNLIDANIVQKLPWNNSFANGDYELDYRTILGNLQQSQGRKLSFDPTSHRYSYGVGGPTPFIRTVNINLISPNEIRVISTVNWISRGNATFSVKLEDHFFNWRQ